MNELAPCGVFCGACPSFEKTCFGCSLATTEQRRTSWKGCQIRICCYEERGHRYCADCADFPCKIIEQKLIKSHPNNPKYTYRHEIPENARKFTALGLEDYLIYLKQKWSCADCGGKVTFYDYLCQECGKKSIV
ncbi:MAG: DUF3795 domain-containing protein [Brevefilum sp.]